MASGRSPPPEIGDEDQEVEVGAEGEEEENAFDIPSKNASHDRLRRWRVWRLNSSLFPLIQFFISCHC